jgi:4-hydroxy 2-oxovalerate aldolase
MGDMTIRPEDVPVVTEPVTESEVLAITHVAGGPTDLRITDSTLRDGSHAMQHQYTEDQVRGVVHALDRAGVQVIEVSHGDGLGGSSFNYGFSKVDEFQLIKAAVDEATRAKIAVLMLPGLGTVQHLQKAHAVGASVARIATHCTEADVSVQHFGEARRLGMETVGFLMLSHMASPNVLARQARTMVDAGAQCVYVVDSAGALILSDAQQRIQAVLDEIGQEAQVGFHGDPSAGGGVGLRRRSRGHDHRHRTAAPPGAGARRPGGGWRPLRWPGRPSTRSRQVGGSFPVKAPSAHSSSSRTVSARDTC